MTGITITASRGVASEPIIEIDGPLPADTGQYGAEWRRYTYHIREVGQEALSGEVHALESEGLVRLIERISIHARRSS